jgi:hypothetical protein
MTRGLKKGAAPVTQLCFDSHELKCNGLWLHSFDPSLVVNSATQPCPRKSVQDGSRG